MPIHSRSGDLCIFEVLQTQVDIRTSNKGNTADRYAPADFFVNLEGINMRLLFQKGATLRQKVVLIPILALVVSMCFVLFSHVLINENVIFPLSIIAIAASAFAIIYFFRVLLDKDSAMSRRIKARGEKTISFMIIYVLITPLILYPSIAVGIPSALHMLVSEPGDLVVTVEYKSSSYRSGKFRYGCFDVQEYKYFFNNEVCGLSKDDWNSFVAGDRIRLSGKKSYFGFSYSQYEKLTIR